MDYEYALKYPARGDWVPRILAGGGLLFAAGLLYMLGFLTIGFGVGLVILPLALVPFVLVEGYKLRVLRRTVHGDAEPPGFDDPASLAVDGVKSLAITVAYLLPVGILGAIGFAVAATGMFLAPEPELGILGFYAVAFLGFPILGLLNIGLNYVKAAGLANFAYEGSLEAAFDVDRIRQVSTSKTWIVAYVIAWGIVLAGGMLTGGGLGYLLLVGFVVQFYVGVVRSHALGQAFAETVDEAGRGSLPPRQSSTGGDWERVTDHDSPPVDGFDPDRSAGSDLQ